MIIPVPGPALDMTEDVLHDLIVALTGLPGDRVRARWQPRPAKTPGPDTSWCALGVTARTSPGSQLRADADDMRVETHEVLDVLVSFYGPQASALALAVREGLRVPLNREGLRAANMAFIGAGQMVNAPELAATAWLNRVDLPLTFRRGPAHRVRGARPEGAVDIPTIDSVPVCGLCAADR